VPLKNSAFDFSLSSARLKVSPSDIVKLSATKSKIEQVTVGPRRRVRNREAGCSYQSNFHESAIQKHFFMGQMVALHNTFGQHIEREMWAALRAKGG
jgi:hypothetical protein